MIRRYKLRFGYDYADGKPSWRSQWDKTGPNMVDFAWSQNKNNLLYAVIEGKDILTNKVSRLVEKEGADFCNFEWLAIASIPINSKETKVEGNNCGAILVSRDERVIVLCDGTIQIELRSPDDKSIHLAGYGR